MKLYPLDGEPGSYQHTAYLDCQATNVYLSAIKMNRAQFSIRKMITIIYRKCTIVPGTQWGGIFIEKQENRFCKMVYKVS